MKNLADNVASLTVFEDRQSMAALDLGLSRSQWSWVKGEPSKTNKTPSISRTRCHPSEARIGLQNVSCQRGLEWNGQKMARRETPGRKGSRTRLVLVSRRWKRTSSQSRRDTRRLCTQAELEAVTQEKPITQRQTREFHRRV